MATATIVDEVAAARGELRAAILRVTHAERTATEAQMVAERASEAVQAARETLSKFAHVDEEADKFRLDAVRAGKSASLPAALRERLLARGRAQEELDGVLRISEQLGAESIDAVHALERAREGVRSAAASVVVARAVEAARELSEINRRRHVLRLLLMQAFAVLPQAHVRGDLMLRAVEDSEPQLPMDRGPEAAAASYWQRQMAHLVADPSAEIDELPDARSLWGYEI